jgi:hypothetical protein
LRQKTRSGAGSLLVWALTLGIEPLQPGFCIGRRSRDAPVLESIENNSRFTRWPASVVVVEKCCGSVAEVELQTRGGLQFTQAERSTDGRTPKTQMIKPAGRAIEVAVDLGAQREHFAFDDSSF